MFGTPTVDSVLKVFSKAIKKLDDVIQYHQSEADAKDNQIDDLITESDIHRNEVLKAVSVQKKLLEFVS